jgi:hypothetical protein
MCELQLAYVEQLQSSRFPSLSSNSQLLHHPALTRYGAHLHVPALAALQSVATIPLTSLTAVHAMRLAGWVRLCRPCGLLHDPQPLASCSTLVSNNLLTSHAYAAVHAGWVQLASTFTQALLASS